MDTERLLKSLENEANEDIMELTSAKISQEKNDILQTIQFKGAELKKYHQLLKNYRYVDQINQIKPGNYIRWFNIIDPEKIRLEPGAYFISFKILDNGCQLFCKRGKYFLQIKMDECIIFQKLSYQEQIILSAVDYLNK
tara:strand:- start:598 stop:1014 length:417 start_codon:yes stop_codon:yes gene_type:complete